MSKIDMNFDGGSGSIDALSFVELFDEITWIANTDSQVATFNNLDNNKTYLLFLVSRLAASDRANIVGTEFKRFEKSAGSAPLGFFGVYAVKPTNGSISFNLVNGSAFNQIGLLRL